MSTVLTQKGQATIPKPIRDLLGLAPGSQVEFVPMPDGGVRLVAVPSPGKKGGRGRFAALRGSASAGMSTGEIMALTRSD